MTPPSGLPKLAAWLLARRLSGEWLDFVAGDLEEEFRQRRRASALRAQTWLWGQVVRCLVAPPPAPIAAAETHPRGDSMIRTILADIRYAVRALAHAPSFSLAVIAVLALGIGANAATFSLINAVLLRPLPFAEPDRLVRLYHIPPQTTFPGMKTFALSPANFYDWQARSTAFERMAIYQARQYTLTGGDRAQTIVAMAVGAGTFDLVRTPPALGRLFRDDEDAPGARVAIISDRFWRNHFGGVSDVIGKSVMLDDQAYPVVGVMPPEFSIQAWGLSSRDIWVPLGYTPEGRLVRGNHNAQVVARLKPGVSLETATAELQSIAKQLEVEYPADNEGWGATIIPLYELIVQDVRTSLVTLLAAVGLVLLIACANVGNLLFSRALARRKEIAIRSALGAGRRRVFQQLLIEALMLSGIGGALGLLLAHVTLGATSSLISNQIPRVDEIALDGRVLAFAFAVSVLAGVLAGALPALRAGEASLTDALKEGGRSDASVGLRTRRILIVCEVALSLVLLMGAGVLARSLVALRGVDAGFEPDHVLTGQIALPETRYDTAARSTAFYDNVLARVRTLPGVQAAGAIDDLPFEGGSVQYMTVDGKPELSTRDQPTVQVRKITPGYLQAMRIALVRGRDIDPADNDVVIVSEAAARLLWGDVDPIGHTAVLPLQSRERILTVIGVVRNIRDDGLNEDVGAHVYEYSRERDWRGMAIVLRTSVPPASLTTALERAVHEIDPNQPVERIRPMAAVLDETIVSQRFSAMLLGLFAAVALTLASVGIYSVLANVVRGRRREIGIRTALGARTTDVLRLVVIEGMTPTLIGIAIGAIAAIASARVLQTMVFGISATDPITLAAVAGVLVLVSLLASLVPALRAARVDPLQTLRGN